MCMWGLLKRKEPHNFLDLRRRPFGWMSHTNMDTLSWVVMAKWPQTTPYRTLTLTCTHSVHNEWMSQRHCVFSVENREIIDSLWRVVLKEGIKGTYGWDSAEQLWQKNLRRGHIGVVEPVCRSKGPSRHWLCREKMRHKHDFHQPQYQE